MLDKVFKEMSRLPELCVQTPEESCSGVRQLRLYVAPLNLNAPPFWRFSALKYRVFFPGKELESEDEVNTGV